ncbi:outer envelope pore protein 16-4, chloroplastic isoform X1 [Selaginella moellendorffii]|uniref:outer envelope pore protein 16-4, chloroplastic isoform X1 n=1 Tax=Selaginella moellendorffii TaxID=88036 RepID=UPI000D1CD464|nr:outer envelope pore protein 16-4, chloroplastic isoform X1 [Selaginella moellendorffii]|eukprot:XP_024538848.1 outer envelope pore protein 16-4, chloroplastic isoform X1 [Selaginella moellendorffii]
MTAIDQPPCSSRTVDAFLRMGMAGFSWGLFVGSYDAGKKGIGRNLSISIDHPSLRLAGLSGLANASYVAKAIANNSVKWGLCGGLYVSLNCGFEVLRTKRDWINGTLAGALTGAAVGSKKIGIIKTALAASVICSTLEMMKPAEYPPTRIIK